MSILNSWFSALWSLLYPPSCAVCGEPLAEGEESLCTLCRVTAPLTGFWRAYDNPVFEKVAAFVPIERASAMLYFVRGSGWQRLIHSFKYHHRWRLAYTMGRWYGALLRDGGVYDDVDVVVPLPLHPWKRILRGYNQSEYLAEGIAASLGVPVVRGALRRHRHTSSQARTPRRERAANVAGAFSVGDEAALAGRHVLLVDDVLTTGSTLTAAVEAMQAAVPDCRVSLAVLAVSRRELGIDR